MNYKDKYKKEAGDESIKDDVMMNANKEKAHGMWGHESKDVGSL